MAEHMELLAELPKLEKMGARERQEIAKKRRRGQLERWKLREAKIQADEPPPMKKSRTTPVRFEERYILLEAAARNDVDEVKRLLSLGVSPDLTNNDGLTPLHQACINDNVEIVHLLVNHGAKVNITDKELWTPLHAAATYGDVALLEFLLNHGANIIAINLEDNMPLDVAIEEVEDDEDMVEAVEFLRNKMEAIGYSVERIEEIKNASKMLMLNDLKDSVEKGRDLDIQDESGATALHIATANGYEDVVDFLLDNNAQVDIEDNDGWQPVHAAACWGHDKILEMLVANGADLDAKTTNGERPYDLCEDDELQRYIIVLRKEMMHSPRTPKSSVTRKRSSSRSITIKRSSMNEKSIISQNEAKAEANFRQSVSDDSLRGRSLSESLTSPITPPADSPLISPRPSSTEAEATSNTVTEDSQIRTDHTTPSETPLSKRYVRRSPEEIAALVSGDVEMKQPSEQKTFQSKEVKTEPKRDEPSKEDSMNGLQFIKTQREQKKDPQSVDDRNTVNIKYSNTDVEMKDAKDREVVKEAGKERVNEVQMRDNGRERRRASRNEENSKRRSWGAYDPDRPYDGSRKRRQQAKESKAEDTSTASTVGMFVSKVTSSATDERAERLSIYKELREAEKADQEPSPAAKEVKKENDLKTEKDSKTDGEDGKIKRVLGDKTVDSGVSQVKKQLNYTADENSAKQAQTKRFSGELKLQKFDNEMDVSTQPVATEVKINSRELQSTAQVAQNKRLSGELVLRKVDKEMDVSTKPVSKRHSRELQSTTFPITSESEKTIFTNGSGEGMYDVQVKRHSQEFKSTTLPMEVESSKPSTHGASLQAFQTKRNSTELKYSTIAMETEHDKPTHKAERSRRELTLMPAGKIDSRSTSDSTAKDGVEPMDVQQDVTSLSVGKASKRKIDTQDVKENKDNTKLRSPTSQKRKEDNKSQSKQESPLADRKNDHLSFTAKKVDLQELQARKAENTRWIREASKTASATDRVEQVQKLQQRRPEEKFRRESVPVTAIDQPTVEAAEKAEAKEAVKVSVKIRKTSKDNIAADKIGLSACKRYANVSQRTARFEHIDDVPDGKGRQTSDRAYSIGARPVRIVGGPGIAVSESKKQYERSNTISVPLGARQRQYLDSQNGMESRDLRNKEQIQPDAVKSERKELPLVVNGISSIKDVPPEKKTPTQKLPVPEKTKPEQLESGATDMPRKRAAPQQPLAKKEEVQKGAVEAAPKPLQTRVNNKPYQTKVPAPGIAVPVNIFCTDEQLEKKARSLTDIKIQAEAENVKPESKNKPMRQRESENKAPEPTSKGRSKIEEIEMKELESENKENKAPKTEEIKPQGMDKKPVAEQTLTDPQSVSTPTPTPTQEDHQESEVPVIKDVKPTKHRKSCCILM